MDPFCIACSKCELSIIKIFLDKTNELDLQVCRKLMNVN